MKKIFKAFFEIVMEIETNCLWSFKLKFEKTFHLITKLKSLEQFTWSKNP